MKRPSDLEKDYKFWEITKDLIDQCIDVTLNLSQSGHPGGSRSKVHGMLITLLSGAMRWDIRDPTKRFADRFVLVAGHDNPMVYATLAVLNESLRIKFEQTQDSKYLVKNGEEFQLTWEDLLTLRQNKGLPGHAEMEGKTLFFKFNTGPSGHGSPAAAGAALAHKLAGTEDVKVFAFEGEGGLSTGVTLETLNSAWGLGLGNLVYYIDWNDFGIDSRPFSSIVNSTPQELFETCGWHVEGTDDCQDWSSFTEAYYDLVVNKSDAKIPKMIYAKSRKGRGYHKFDEKSHGAPHKRNSELFWKTKEDFASKYNMEFPNFGEKSAPSREGQVEQGSSYLKTVFSVLRNNQELVDYLANRLVELGDSVPEEFASCKIKQDNPLDDKELFNFTNYPSEIFAEPGDKVPNRVGFSKIASWLNSYSRMNYDRPLFVAMSADLADSTNISGFSKGWGDMDDMGMFSKEDNSSSPLMPQGITEFANSGMMAGLSTVNFSSDTLKSFNGFIGSFSTYGSFSYLKYGPIRLFSQVAQDSQIKVGKLLWIAGHSGPETAEDSRTHFGIFAPGVTQLFPKGHIINLHPWEHNDVAPALAAAFSTNVPIVALHLTRPAIEVPDRKKLGISSHLEASKGAYLIRDYDDRPHQGVVIVRGTSSTNSVVSVLDEISSKFNVKIVSAISWELFDMQSSEYKSSIISKQEWADSMIISNTGLSVMKNWISNRVVAEYSLTPDWDNRWRTGGSLEQIIDEAHLSPRWVMKSLEKFTNDRKKRLVMLRQEIPEN
ncbi:MAG: 1-deoxy-D-xylulose-5-phosphate synthase N-terminal domain-containing protein [Candidatus Thermoplasmatota archaeon]|nr:1-deoxy-D-xylulose-5-phosphate synthase N-terminal domain-containing protein [Candidatus Thermoplasmatota archaeon]